jgi:hypothetical protein
MRAKQFLESALGTNPKRPARTGSRPDRGHEATPRYKTNEGVIDVPALSKRIIQMRQSGQNDQQIRAQLIKESIPPRYIDQAFTGAELSESKTQKQETPKPRNFVAKNAINSGAGAHKDKKKAVKQGDTKHKGRMMDLAEMEDEVALIEKASRALCTGGIPDKDLGASNLASCKSQGLRARDGEKSHLITAGKRKVRITVGGKKLKGRKYGGPLPDYGTRKNQK